MVPFSIIVAVDQDNGIGKGGQLPWHLPADLRHFKEITTQGDTQNVVIMGRKTWESLPEKFRPLPNRYNVVMTRNKDYPLPDEVSRAVDDHAFELSLFLENLRDQLGLDHPKVFVIGGAQIFKKFIGHPDCHTIYMTKINQSFGCDVFFPPLPKRFTLAQSSAPQMEQGINFAFQEFIA